MNNHDHFIGFLVERNIFGLINDYPVITIAWNLFLLVVPFFLCWKLSQIWQKTKLKKPLEKVKAFFLGLFWLLFIPNTAYIITDVRHLAGACPLNETRICAEGAWAVLFFFTYAILGWIAYVYLVNQMKELIVKIWGIIGQKIYLWCLPPLIALGVLLGLVNRWNSWDLFLYPLELMRGALLYFTDWTYFKNLLIYSFFLYILYFIGDYFFKKRTKW